MSCRSPWQSESVWNIVALSMPWNRCIYICNLLFYLDYSMTNASCRPEWCTGTSLCSSRSSCIVRVERGFGISCNLFGKIKDSLSIVNCELHCLLNVKNWSKKSPPEASRRCNKCKNKPKESQQLRWQICISANRTDTWTQIHVHKWNIS